MPVIITRGDARRLPLPDASVDLLVTSPPYYSLRSYTDQGSHYSAQIGAEATPGEYIANLLECTREWVRVLKDSGSIFVNLGDTYSSYQGVRVSHDRNLGGKRESRGEGKGFIRGAPSVWGIPPKSLLGVPWRYATACVDELGLILRRDIIWSKPNGIPESVDDRARSSHEYVFHLVKSRRYFTAVDEIREDHTPESYVRMQPGRALPGRRDASIYNGHPSQSLSLEHGLHPLGRLPGSVWTIPVQPLIGPQCRLVMDGRTVKWFRTWDEGWQHMRFLSRVPYPLLLRDRPSLRTEEEHYAAFPMELPRRIIQGWSPKEICTACGEGRFPVTDVKTEFGWMRGTDSSRLRSGSGHDGETAGQKVVNRRVTGITGYACGCTPFTDHPATGERYGGQDGPPGGLRGKNTGMTKYRPGENADGSAARRVGPRREYHLDGWVPPPSRPAVVLDPFGGTGTTALVASAYGRTGVTVDYSHSYSRFARWRTSDTGERAKAMQVRKPPPAPGPAQGTLFDLEV